MIIIIPSRSVEPTVDGIKRDGWGRRKKCPVATLAFAAIMASGSFFSRSYLLVMSWAERVLCAGWLRARQGSAGPTVEHVGSLHAMAAAQSLYRHQPCLFRWSFSSLILLSLLVFPV
jgi:hypothetical protein